MEKIKERILVVDDEKIVHESCGRILREEGYEVENATSGEEALHRVGKKHYDLVLIDIRMPDMDGIETLEQIREKNPDIPVVVFTGYPSIETARDSMRLGVCDYLPKPFTSEELLDAVNKSVDKAKKVLQKRAEEDKLRSIRTTSFTASSIMRSKLVTCGADTSLREVVKKMIYENVRSVLVKRSEKVEGIIVDKKILNMVAEGKDFNSYRAADIMSCPLECCDADDNLEKCMELFEQTKHSRLVVLKDGEVIGILLRKFAERFLTIAKRFSLAEIAHRPRFRAGRW